MSPRRRPGAPLALTVAALQVVGALLGWAPLGGALSGCDAPGDPPVEEADQGPPVLALLMLDEPPSGSERGSLLNPRAGASTEELITRLGEVREEDHIRGLFVRIGPMGGAWGRSADIAEALQGVREAGKPVHCHLLTTDNAGYVLAARSCDRISMTPAGVMDAVGVSAHLFYARSMLSSIGVRAEILQVGRFKGAAEPFTRDDISEEMRASMGGLLDDLQRELIEAAASRADVSPERAQEILDSGPHTARQAQEAGLIDAVAFDDEAESRARQAAEVDRSERLRVRPETEQAGIGELLDALSGDRPEETVEGRRIVLAHLEGTILDGESPTPGGSHSGPFIRAMRRFANDDEVAAVVLRVDSPGGSALASDRMWNALRRVAARKPVIVSVGDMAASGGYYIACAGTRIFAEPGSIVGSIGVVGGKADLSGLMERIGVHAVVLSRGEHAAWSSPTRPFSDSERAVLRRMMADTYRRFLRRVSSSREIPRETLEASAEGRIFGGRTALDRHLIDEIGGLSAALAHAREAAELEEDAPIETWPPSRTLLDSVADAVSGSDPQAQLHLERQARQVAGALSGLPAPILHASELAQLLASGERQVVMLPAAIELR